ncbi:capsule biosynthesis protein [Maritimibacter sp. HL-12]|jgi:capsular polysaccharide transport system permease protein|uniref:capsule biosynthesis protein n=1 Tax=Maritimibacter sp. HL-12 TaxID=1162418 RepID=UPI000A0F28FC|nr:capsule biosynthesis protein [Maritimibacter sp. HL-12]SMH35231.1 capsular polysaccharide transport system permease protein [Maritimibacter sp. HL-12]
MTTKPKAKKFRIRRSSVFDGGQATEEARPDPAENAPRSLNPLEESVVDGTEDGFPDEGFSTAGRGSAKPANDNPDDTGDAHGEDELAAIRKEGLTGRQLRMARRLAQKHGLPATSDYDAVRLLRRAGIDPFHRANMLELVSADGGPLKGPGGGNLPQTVPGGGAGLPQTIQSQKAQLPSTNVMNAAERARSVIEIQKDIARRRRRKLVLLFTRLAFFVFLPTLLAGYYYYAIATPMYATKSEFVIQKAESSQSGLGSLFAGSGLATSQDSVTVQSYLTSRDAMLRLDAELGFKSHFSDPEIDPIQRLDANASNEQAYKLYKRNVKIGFDPTEGIVKMEVVAANPELSAAFSEALIRYSEERVDNLTARLRDDQMAGAMESYLTAEERRVEAQSEVLRLQQDLGVFDATSDASAVMTQVTNFETQLAEKQLQLQQLLDNARPNQARVEGVRGDIRRLESLIVELRGKLTEAGGTTASGGSLAQISGQLAIAQSDLETRTALLQQALQQLESARIEANKQTRYLEMGVHPVAPDQPTYPRAFENTILAFLVFSGIYLMLSLTASILREQVSG